MRVAVVGAGGVGGYFGGRLAQAGQDVFFVARGEHLAAIRARGLHVRSLAGDFTIDAVQAAADPADVGVVDVVLVAVKAHQLAAAAASIAPLVGASTLVIGLQNGVEAATLLATAVGEAHVAGGSCAIVSFIEEPGVIRHAGAIPRIVFGELGGGKSERCERLREAFEPADGVRAVHSDAIQVEIWRKFLFIAPVSGVAAVTRVPLGVCRQIPQSRGLIEQAMHEVLALAHARGVDLPGDAPDRALEFLDGLPAESTASMQRDLMEGRPSELEAQNGAIVRLGAAAGVPTPVNSFLHAALLPQELEARAVAR